MHEVFPIAAGIAVALLTTRFVAARARLVVLVLLSLVAGFGASWLSGELAVSWGFVPIDVAEVLLAAGLTAVVVRTQERRAAFARNR